MPQITLENNIKVEISQESYDNLVNAVKEWPKDGDLYFFNNPTGDTLSREFDNHEIDKKRQKQNNCYRTREDAEMGSKRDRLMRTPNTAKDKSRFWVWSFLTKDSEFRTSWVSWLTQPKFATKQEAKDWGEEAQPVFEFFSK